MLKAPPWLYSSIFMNMRKIWNARETRKAVLNFLWGNIREFVLRFPVPTFAVVAPQPYYDFVCVLLSFCKYLINNRFAWHVSSLRKFAEHSASKLLPVHWTVCMALYFMGYLCKTIFGDKMDWKCILW